MLPSDGLEGITFVQSLRKTVQSVFLSQVVSYLAQCTTNTTELNFLFCLCLPLDSTSSSLLLYLVGGVYYYYYYYHYYTTPSFVGFLICRFVHLARSFLPSFLSASTSYPSLRERYLVSGTPTNCFSITQNNSPR
ncbi:hypothetical protein BZA77DRAFT_4538 [Pyronema omphalodes]|nr:hypothetical protein BZA77DRAFT_4538 [Pyronema omphalodes]